MRETRKLFTPGGRKFILFIQFSRDIFFSSLVSFTFFVFLFCLFVCLFFCLFVCFLNIKTYILMDMRICGRVSVSDKNFFTRQISGNKTPFLTWSKNSSGNCFKSAGQTLKFSFQLSDIDPRNWFLFLFCSKTFDICNGALF